eukprot:1938198-Rhodomonas_salina.2
MAVAPSSRGDSLCQSSTADHINTCPGRDSDSRQSNAFPNHATAMHSRIQNLPRQRSQTQCLARRRLADVASSLRVGCWDPANPCCCCWRSAASRNGSSPIWV